MALVTYDKDETPLNQTIAIDTDGENYLGTIQVGMQGATILPTIISGTGTFVLGKHRNDVERSTATIRPYEDGAVLDGDDKSVYAGVGTDLYLTVSSASSLVLRVDMDQW